MILKRLIPFPLLACLIFTVVGCSQHSATNSTSASLAEMGLRFQATPLPPIKGTLKVALLTTGPVTDDGWNQLAYSGLLKIHQDLGAQIAKQENLKDAQFADAFRDYASQGYNIIFAHGDEFSDAAAKVAVAFPNTIFVTSGGSKTGSNLMEINFKTEEGTYLQGMEAGMVSKSGKGGFIGGQALPPVARAAEGFANGAKAINPKFDFQTTYINSWDDTAAARAQTDALLNAGSDVLAHNCDAAAKGMFDDVKSKPGVYAFGVNSDQNHIAPNVLSSVFLNFPQVMTDIARKAKMGTLIPVSLTLGIKDGNILLLDNPHMNVITPAEKEKIKLAQLEIAAGKLSVAR